MPFIFTDHTSVIVAGGEDDAHYLEKVEVLGNRLGCDIPDLPDQTFSKPSVFQLGQNIFICGGTMYSYQHYNKRRCYKLENNTWTEYNTLISDRTFATHITTKTDEVYIFGGRDSPFDSEILRLNHTKWQKGQDIPDRLDEGCGVRISETELLLIGGYNTSNRILKYNINDGTWHNTSIHLKIGRLQHRCILFKNKVFVTGGIDMTPNAPEGYLRSTEIIEVGKNGELSIRIGPNLYIPRYNHGMGIMTIGRVPTLIAFGGLNGIKPNNAIDVWHEYEMWNSTREKWKISRNMIMSQPKSAFGFATVSTDLICP